ncbi:MAG: single-stranded DNA-binding protein [Verrucomicrobiales bacterium]|nr:single-stranded DNA-binding protein [Verrucomicrobiales bacterium]
MSSLNKVMLIGNLTRDPELKKTQGGASLSEIGLAVNRTRKNDQGERINETTFIDITVWGKTAENVAKYLKKGRSVLIEGRLQLDSWQDQQTGQTRNKLRVIGENVQFLGGNQENADKNPDSDSYREAA